MTAAPARGALPSTVLAAVGAVPLFLSVALGLTVHHHRTRKTIR